MKREIQYRWRINWGGRWTTTAYHCTEQHIRTEHPEAAMVPGTLRVIEVPETPEEIDAAYRHTDTSKQGDYAPGMRPPADDDRADSDRRKRAIRTPMELLIHIEGASSEELQRGVAAAQDVFDAAGVTAWEAAVANFNMTRESEELEIAGADVKMTGDSNEAAEKQSRAAHAWDDADYAAAQACCAGWAAIPDTANLELNR